MPDLQPRFSVVIPCYRAAATIGAALASVRMQSHAPAEVIVVDDGSPDNSAELAGEALCGLPGGRLIRQANAGASVARNAGAAAALGTHLAFLDADDRWSPDALARHAAHLAARPGLGISFGRVRFWDPALAVPGRVSAHRAGLGLADVLAENPLCATSNIVVRRDLFQALGGFDSSLSHAEDQEFIARLIATTGAGVAGIDATLVDYRTSPGGLSADLERMMAGWEAMMARVEAYADPVAFAAIAPGARALYRRYLARRALRTGAPARRAAGHLLAALATRPRALLGAETCRTLLTLAGTLAAFALPRGLVAPFIAR